MVNILEFLNSRTWFLYMNKFQQWENITLSLPSDFVHDKLSSAIDVINLVLYVLAWQKSRAINLCYSTCKCSVFFASYQTEETNNVNGLVSCCQTCANQCKDFSGEISELCFLKCARRNCHTFCAATLSHGAEIGSEKMKING